MPLAAGQERGYPAFGARAPWLGVAAAIFFLIWPFSISDGVLTAGALAVALLGADFCLAVAPQKVRVARAFPGTVVMGTTAGISWTVTNPTGRPLVVHVADQLAPSLQASARRYRARVAAHRSVSISATVSPQRRGLFTPTELVVRTEGPLGLLGRQARRAAPSVLRVYPGFGSRRAAELRVERARILEVGLRSARSRGGGTDFDQLRDYSVDDDSRRIDWAATARSDRAIVRAYRAERNQRVVSLLDNGRTMAGQVAGAQRSEHGIDGIMMLTAVAARMGDLPGLVAFDREVRAVVPPALGGGQLAKITGALYDLVPQLVPSDYRGAFSHVLARFQRRAMLCLFTELEEGLIDSLLPSLPLVSRTHLLLVASVQGPELKQWASGAPADIDEAYRQAAAMAALKRRRELAALLKSYGAIVVDAPAGRLAALVTDAYLDIKASGRL